MRILVTGSNGFIGQHLVPVVGKAGTVYTCTSQECDLLDSKAVTAFLREVMPTHCVHLAWYTQRDYAKNRLNIAWLEASQHLIREFYAYGGKRFVGVGTCFEYTLVESASLAENSSTLPHTLYGKCKLALGAYLRNFGTKNHVSWAWCRPFFITGPGESLQRLIPAACAALLRNETFYSKNHTRILDYMDVRDVANAISQVLHSDFQGKINIAAGKGQVVGEMLARIVKIINNGRDINRTAQLSKEKDIVADVAILKNIIKYNPRYSLQETLVACLEDVRRRVNEP